MGFMDLVGSGKRAMFGGAKTKAVIVFRQCWEEEDDALNKTVDKDGQANVNKLSKVAKTHSIKIEKAVTVAKAKGAGGVSATGGSIPGADAMTSAATSALDAASNAVTNAVSAATGGLLDSSNTTEAGGVKKGKNEKRNNKKYNTVKYTVMFNPETLSISTNGGGYRMVQTYNNGAKDGESDANVTCRSGYVPDPNKTMSLSVNLIFDKVNGSDAFSQVDPFGLSLTGGSIKSLVNLCKNYSVQRDVEGFLGAIQDKRTTEIDFTWGNMCYTGSLTAVDAEYVMFNPKGEPIRAIVSLTLRIIDPMIKPGYMGQYFSQVFENVLSDQSAQDTGTLSWNTASNKVSGLINL